MSNLPKLQELLDKTAFFKHGPLVIPDLWVRVWDDITYDLDTLQDPIRIIKSILKDMNLDLDEIPRLDETLEKMARMCNNFQNKYQKDAPTFQFLFKMLDCSANLATPIPFIKNMETSMSGDHVSSVQKDKLYYGELAKLGNFIVNLHGFFSLPGSSSSPSEKKPVNNYLVVLREMGGRLLDEFTPGVVYRKIPDVVGEIGNITTKINDLLKPARVTIEHHFFVKEIKKARECLSILVVSEELKEQKPIKLKGILGTKGKAKDLVYLLSALPFDNV